MDQKPTEWYNHGLGLVVAIIFFPLFSLWWIWAKSGWNKGVKWTLTVVITLLLIGIIASGDDSVTQTATQPTPTITPTITPTMTVTPTAEITPTITPAPTATPTQQVKKWQTIISFSGVNQKRSDFFHLSGTKARLSYTLTGGDMTMIGIYVVEKGQSLEKDGGLPELDAQEAGKGSTYLYKDAGDYYFDVTVANAKKWKVTIEEEK